LRRRIEIRQDFPSVFEIEKESAVGNLKVQFCKAKYELKIHYQFFLSAVGGSKAI